MDEYAGKKTGVGAQSLRLFYVVLPLLIAKLIIKAIGNTIIKTANGTGEARLKSSASLRYKKTNLTATLLQ